VSERIEAAIGAVLVGLLLVTAVGAVTDMSAVEILIGVPEPTAMSRGQMRDAFSAFSVAAVVVSASLGAWWLIGWFKSRESADP
jgi:hypothetical protein